MIDLKDKKTNYAFLSGAVIMFAAMTLFSADGGLALSGDVTTAGQDCTVGDVIVSNGETVIFYKEEKSEDCTKVDLGRMCIDGKLTGTDVFQYAKCVSPE